MIEKSPPATDVLLQMSIPHAGGGPPCRLQIDKLPDGRYRATAASLFEEHDLELCRTSDLEQVLRHAYRLGVCRSFREVLAAMEQLNKLDDSRTGRTCQPAWPARARPQPRAARRHGGATRRFWPVKRRLAGRLVQGL